MSCCSNPIVLAIDTSSKLTSLAVARSDRIIGSFGAELDGRRSERLWTEIGFLLAELDLTINDIDLFSVCVGPGGFTGVRVGVAAVKGFASAASKPVAAVTSLEAAACTAEPAHYGWAALSAYKGEAYVQLFELSSNQLPTPVIEPRLARLETLSKLIATQANATLVTDQAIANMQEVWPCDVKAAPRFSAEQVARLGLLRFIGGETLDANLLRACYVRPPDAEIKLNQRRVREGGNGR